MAKHSLLHRADCHASGTAEQYAAAVKLEQTIYLCYHHTGTLAPSLADNGWELIVINEKVSVPA